MDRPTHSRPRTPRLGASLRRRALLASLAAAACSSSLVVADSASAHPAAPTISRTNRQATSAGARCVNAALARLYPSTRRIGGYAPPAPGSWTFGRDTEAFVRDLQRFGRLTADGVVGRRTGSLIWYLWDAQPRPASFAAAVAYRSWQSEPSGFYDYTCYQVVPSRN